MKCRYMQIGQEALALIWVYERFSALKRYVETDNKSLIPILANKSLDSLPPRVLRFHLRLMRFQYTSSCPDLQEACNSRELLVI